MPCTYVLPSRLNTNLLNDVFIIGVARDQPVCGANEIEIDCAPLAQCQRSCDRPRGGACPRMCALNRCVCKLGYVRVSRTNQTCIEQTECAPSKFMLLIRF